MEEQTVPKPKPAQTGRVRSQRFRAGAVIVVAVAVGLVLWLVLRGGNSNSTSSGASAASEQQLKNLAASVNHPIFWVGPRSGNTYELRQVSNGSIYIRYLPSGAKVGTSSPYTTVATYPFPNAYQALKNLKSKDLVFVKIPKGGIAEYSKKYPASVHAAYPGVDYQVEVYDPTNGIAAGLLASGQLKALGNMTAGSATTAPKPTAATPAKLAAVARSLGHSIYWAGPKKRYTYELTQAPSGNVYIRYLPPGVAVGAPKPYLSVATYPFKGAFAATQALTKDSKNAEIQAPGGAVAVYSKGYPQSIHLAYPGSDYQIEVFDPSAARARAVVTSGRITAIG